MHLLVIFGIALLVFGPKKLPELLGHVARAKAQFEKATHSFKSELEAELESNIGMRNRILRR